MKKNDYKTVTQGSTRCNGAKGHLEKEMSAVYALVDVGMERDGKRTNPRYLTMVACPEYSKGKCKNSDKSGIPYDCHVQRGLDKMIYSLEFLDNHN